VRVKVLKRVLVGGIAVLIVLLVLSIVALRQIDFEVPNPAMVIENQLDFEVLLLVEAEADQSWQEFVDANEIASLFVMEPGRVLSLATRATQAATRSGFCTSELRVWHFLRVADGSDFDTAVFERPAPGLARPDVVLDSEDFELVHTLGPGFCHENRRDDTYVIGDEPWATVADFQDEEAG